MWTMIAKWIAKRFLLGLVNEVLAKYKDDTAKCKAIVETWTLRLQKLLLVFNGFLAKLDDGRLDDVEVDDTIDKITDVVKEW